MAHEHRSKKRRRREKLLKKLRKTQAAPPEGNRDMAAGSSPIEVPTPTKIPAPPHGDTAPIRAVTAEMMESAGREAARLADGVAHHTIHHEGHPAPPPADAAPGRAVGPGAVGAVLDAVPRQVGEVAEAAVQAISDGAAEASRVPSEAAAEAVRGAEGAVSVPRREGAVPPGSPAALQRYNAKVLAICQTNVAAAGAFLTALMDARTLPEAAQVNADHMARGLQALTGQGRELADLAQELALDALRPSGDTRGGA